MRRRRAPRGCIRLRPPTRLGSLRNGWEVCLLSQLLTRAQPSRSKAELEAPGHWRAGGVASRRQGKAAFSIGRQGSLRHGKVLGFHFLRAGWWRVRIGEGNVAEARRPQSGRFHCLHFRAVRLGRVLFGKRRLRPRLRQGEDARQSCEGRPASHIHIGFVDVLRIYLPNCASSCKLLSWGHALCPCGAAISRDAPCAWRVRVLLAARQSGLTCGPIHALHAAPHEP